MLVTVVYGPPAVLIVVPLAAFLVYSFFWVEKGTLHYALSFRNYGRFFSDDTFIRVFGQTVFLCLEVAGAATVVAYPVAYFLSKLRGWVKPAMVMVFLIPLLMSYIMKIYAVRSILGANGLLNKALLALGILSEPSTLFVFNLNAILLTQLILLIPFAIMPIFLSLERIPRSLVEASVDVGASKSQTFARVVLPLSMPGAVAAASFVFILAIGDFLTPQMVGGPSGFTFGRIIYSQFGIAYNWPFGAALSVILVAVIVVALALASRYGSRWRGRT